MGFANLSKYYADYRFPKPFDTSSTQILSVSVIVLIGSVLLVFGAGLFGS
jgi:hypothetical protein